MINTNTESIHCKLDKKSNMLMYSAALLLNCQRENLLLKILKSVDKKDVLYFMKSFIYVLNLLYVHLYCLLSH